METPLSPLEFSRRARRLYPNREAVIDGDLRLTYAQFFERCDRWSAALQQLGIRQGDRVAYVCPNTHRHLESFYAVPQIGAVLVPINFRLTADDFAYILNHSGASMVCAHPDYFDALDSIRDQVPGVKHFVALEGTRDGWIDYEGTVQAAPPKFVQPEISERDLISINYTSGTTARPKGVMITHRNAWINVVGTLVHLHMSPADRYLWTVPMFHANGWTFVWTVTAAGGIHVCLRKVEAKLLFETMAREGITMLGAAPTVLITMVNAPAECRRLAPRNVRVLAAGAPPAAATIQRVEGDLGWTIVQLYGLTEISPFLTICEPRPEHASLSFAERAEIKARQGVEIITAGHLRVVDENGRDVPNDGHTMGEVLAHGNAVMAGYYNDPEATSRAIRDGWFHTGDAGVIHLDGYLEIRDRFKDVIISGGENISSVEVEGVYFRHPAIQEVAIVAVPHERWGEAPHAFVVLRPGGSTTETDLREYGRNHLAHFKVPQGFTFLNELPKTATGKIQKYVLRGCRPGIVRQ